MWYKKANLLFMVYLFSIIQLVRTEVNQLHVIKEFNCTAERLPLTSILAHPLNNQLILASTSSAVLQLNLNGDCHVLLGDDNDVPDKCFRVETAGAVSFGGIVQLEYARPWSTLLSQYSELVLIVDFIQDVVWRHDLVTNVTNAVCHHCLNSIDLGNIIQVSYITQDCGVNSPAKDFWLFQEDVRLTRAEVVLVDVMSLDDTQEDQMNRISGHFLFPKNAALCKRSADVAVGVEKPFTELERYVWVDDSLIYLNHSGQFIANDTFIPLLNDVDSSAYQGGISLVNEFSDTVLVGVMEETNKIVLLQEEATTKDNQQVSTDMKQRFNLLSMDQACSDEDVTQSWFSIRYIESCLYTCISRGRERCAGVSFDVQSCLCQLHSVVTLSSVYSEHAACYSWV